jgi:endoglucanase
VAACTPTTPTAPPYETVRAEAERFVGGRVVADATASAKSSLWMVSNGSATGSATAPVTSTWFEVRARGDQCDGAPLMTVRVDGRTVASTPVTAKTWTTYGWSGTWGAGKHTVSIGFSNDRRTAACDRNLRVDHVAMRSTVKPLPSTPNPTPKPTVSPTPTPTPTVPSVPPTATNPFAGASFHVDPQATAAVRAAALKKAGNTEDAARLGKIAGQPAAAWFTDALAASNVTAAVKARVDTVTAAGALPVLVAYAIPDRDCGGHSAGGIATTAGYADWIARFAAGIGTRRAVVVLEPDSVAQWDCLSESARADRVTNLRAAVSALTASGSVAVYLDGGHSNWQPVATMASRLRSFDLAKVRGFATNVANYNATPAEVGYGDQLAAELDKHYVVDTSRNGSGPSSEWCNPAGQALGLRPSAATTSAAADAWFWIKRPGESDGTCNGGPSAGAWFESYALGLASRAAW